MITKVFTLSLTPVCLFVLHRSFTANFSLLPAAVLLRSPSAARTSWPCWIRLSRQRAPWWLNLARWALSVSFRVHLQACYYTFWLESPWSCTMTWSFWSLPLLVSTALAPAKLSLQLTFVPWASWLVQTSLYWHCALSWQDLFQQL